jgi:hypothetical protein
MHLKRRNASNQQSKPLPQEYGVGGEQNTPNASKRKEIIKSRNQ